MRRREVAMRYRLPLYVALVLAFVFLSACKTTTDANAAAKQLNAIAGQLCNYYDDLSKQLNETVQLNELLQAIYSIPFDSAARAQVLQAKAEIDKRSAIAHAMADMAAAYSKLAGSDASADASKAASSLADELSTAKALPQSAGIPDAAGEAARMLTAAAQSHSLKEGAAAIRQAVAAVSDIFDREQNAYESIEKQRLALAQQIAIKLLSNHEIDIDSSTLMAPATDPFDLHPKSQDISGNPKYIELVKSDIDYQVEEQEREYAESTRKLSADLQAVRAAVERIAGKT